MLGRGGRGWRGCTRGLRRPRCMACVWRERLRERLIRRDLPDHRREPVLECKGLAPIASEETAVGGGFEETEVDPGDEESELDEHKGGGAEEDDEDVGDEEVDAGEGLRA